MSETKPIHEIEIIPVENGVIKARCAVDGMPIDLTIIAQVVGNGIIRDSHGNWWGTIMDETLRLQLEHDYERMQAPNVAGGAKKDGGQTIAAKAKTYPKAASYPRRSPGGVCRG